MQEQALSVNWKISEITVKALMGLIKTLVENNHKIVHGQQSLKKLNRQDKALENVELFGKDIAVFRKELKRYEVDFSVKKNKETGEYTVFFKSQDINRVHKGLENVVKNFDKEEKKKPMKETMEQAEQKAQEKAAERGNEKSKTKDRGQEI